MLVTMRRGGGWAIRGMGDVTNPAEIAVDPHPVGGLDSLPNIFKDFSVSNVIAGAKVWASPAAAVGEIKNFVTGSSANSGAHMVGLIGVPLVALAVLPGLFKGRRRRRR